MKLEAICNICHEDFANVIKDMDEEGKITFMDLHSEEHKIPGWEKKENPEEGKDPQNWKGDKKQRDWVMIRRH